MSGFKVGDKVVCTNLTPMKKGGRSWATEDGCEVGRVYTVRSIRAHSLRLEDHQFHLPVMNFKLFDKEEDLNTYYCVNGDVVEARRTGDVFLYLGGMYYNLSAKGKEMRGRKHIKRDDGPIVKLSNLSDSGDLFKEAILEGRFDEVPF